MNEKKIRQSIQHQHDQNGRKCFDGKKLRRKKAQRILFHRQETAEELIQRAIRKGKINPNAPKKERIENCSIEETKVTITDS